MAPKTVRIHQNGWARLSEDLVADGAEWLFINVAKDRHHVLLRTTTNPEAGTIKLDFHAGRRRSPVFWFRPWLRALGIPTSEAVGTYKAVRRTARTVVIDLRDLAAVGHARFRWGTGIAQDRFRPGFLSRPGSYFS